MPAAPTRGPSPPGPLPRTGDLLGGGLDGAADGLGHALGRVLHLAEEARRFLRLQGGLALTGQPGLFALGPLEPLGPAGAGAVVTHGATPVWIPLTPRPPLPQGERGGG